MCVCVCVCVTCDVCVCVCVCVLVQAVLQDVHTGSIQGRNAAGHGP